MKLSEALEKKRQVVEHYEKSVEWAETVLANLSEDAWRTPVGIDKWTIAEIIGHMIPWDEFVLDKRIPYFERTDSLPASPDAEKVNSLAACISRTETKSDTLKRFITVRKKLICSLKELPSEIWGKNQVIGKGSLSIYAYFSGLAEHDWHHYRQIRKWL